MREIKLFSGWRGRYLKKAHSHSHTQVLFFGEIKKSGQGGQSRQGRYRNIGGKYIMLQSFVAVVVVLPSQKNKYNQWLSFMLYKKNNQTNLDEKYGQYNEKKRTLYSIRMRCGWDCATHREGDSLHASRIGCSRRKMWFSF